MRRRRPSIVLACLTCFLAAVTGRAADPKPLYSLKCDSTPPLSAAFWFDGKGEPRALVPDKGGFAIKPFDRPGVIKRLPPDLGNVAAVSRDGKLVALAGASLSVVDVASGKVKAAIASNPRSQPLVLFSPSGKELAVAQGEQLTLWDAANGKQVATAPKLASKITAVAFSSDGKHIAAGCQVEKAGEVHVWDTATLKEVIQFKGPNNYYQVDFLTFTPDGKAVVAVFERTTGVAIEGRTLDTGKPVAGFNDLNPKGVDVAAFVGMGQMDVGELREFQVVFSPDGKLVALGAHGGVAVLPWPPDKAPGAVVPLPNKTGSPVTTLAFSDNGKRLLVRTREGATVWEVEKLPPRKP